MVRARIIISNHSLQLITALCLLPSPPQVYVARRALQRHLRRCYGWPAVVCLASRTGSANSCASLPLAAFCELNRSLRPRAAEQCRRLGSVLRRMPSRGWWATKYQLPVLHSLRV